MSRKVVKLECSKLRDLVFQIRNECKYFEKNIKGFCRST